MSDGDKCDTSKATEGWRRKDLKKNRGTRNGKAIKMIGLMQDRGSDEEIKSETESSER